MTYGNEPLAALRTIGYLEAENRRLTNLLNTVCNRIHNLSNNLDRLEFGIPEDGVGQINMFPMLRKEGDGEQNDQTN